MKNKTKIKEVINFLRKQKNFKGTEECFGDRILCLKQMLIITYNRKKLKYEAQFQSTVDINQEELSIILEALKMLNENL